MNDAALLELNDDDLDSANGGRTTTWSLTTTSGLQATMDACSGDAAGYSISGGLWVVTCTRQ